MDTVEVESFTQIWVVALCEDGERPREYQIMKPRKKNLLVEKL